MTYIAMGLILTLFAGCTTTRTLNTRIGGNASEQADASNWILMTGKWYGQQKLNNGGLREWLVDRRNDGTYSAVFVTRKKNGTLERLHEVGKWGISGDIYFTIFEGWIEDGELRKAMPQDQYTRDAYRILSLTEEDFRYSSIEESDIFRVVKVSDDYEI